MKRTYEAPSSTYRLQLNREQDLAYATGLVDYLADLGVDWVYSSPLLTSRAGSSHGYDIVDPSRIDPELGSRAALDELTERLKTRNMGLLVDVVANHMGAYVTNPWWRDLLEAGLSSPFARYFDVELPDGKVSLPVLGEDVATVLERGELGVERRNADLWLRYWERRFPLSLESWHLILAPAAELLAKGDRQGAALLREVATVPRSLDQEARARQHRELADLIRLRPGAAEAVDAAASALSADDLRALLDAQHYRLCCHRDHAPVSYRRFFDVSDLVAVRVEDTEAFDARHAVIIELARRRAISGLRIDHVDGLLDPETYLRRLREALGEPPQYVVVEKILGPGESLRPFPVDGTTGYDALRLLDGVLLDREGAERLVAHYRNFTGEPRPFAEIVLEAKRTVLAGSLRPEVDQLVDRLLSCLDGSPGRDVVTRALVELVAAFDVYRSYVRPDATVVDGEDRRRIEAALARAAGALDDEAARVLSNIGRVLLLAVSPDRVASCRGVLLRFQQLTGPAAAKGLEDTAFYRWFPLAALCEVGGEPDALGVTLGGFHQALSERQASWPLSLTATSTHDTKRSEDVRTRLLALSEMPEAYYDAIAKWSALNERHKRRVNDQLAPSTNDEYLTYQLLLGAWPMDGPPGADFFERIHGALLKSAREAKQRTAWVDGNPEYEAALEHFLRALLDPELSGEFLRSFLELLEPLRDAGRLASLSLLTLKLAAPGVPDFYQGTELWALDLVDPDNRRPVDFERHKALFAELRRTLPNPRELLAQAADGRIKLWLTWRGLELRRRRAQLFREGRYVPALVRGPRANNVVSFARIRGEEAALAVAGRHYLGLSGSTAAPLLWEKSELVTPEELPAGTYRDVFTWTEHQIAEKNPLRLSELLAQLPVALLERVS